jgi:hypothetical protein
VIKQIDKRQTIVEYEGKRLKRLQSSHFIRWFELNESKLEWEEIFSTKEYDKLEKTFERSENEQKKFSLSEM